MNNEGNQLQYKNINVNNNGNNSDKNTNNEILSNIFLTKVLNLLTLILKNGSIDLYLIQNKKFLQDYNN